MRKIIRYKGIKKYQFDRLGIDKSRSTQENLLKNPLSYRLDFLKDTHIENIKFGNDIMQLALSVKDLYR